MKTPAVSVTASKDFVFIFFVSYYITQNTNLPSRSSQSVQHMAPFITIPDSLHDILNRVGLGFDSTVNHIALYDLITTWRFCRPDFKQINRHTSCWARIIRSTVFVCDLENVAQYRCVHRLLFASWDCFPLLVEPCYTQNNPADFTLSLTVSEGNLRHRALLRLFHPATPLRLTHTHSLRAQSSMCVLMTFFLQWEGELMISFVITPSFTSRPPWHVGGLF